MTKSATRKYGIIYYEGDPRAENGLHGPYMLDNFYEAHNKTEGRKIGIQKLIGSLSQAQVVKLFEAYNSQNAWLILKVIPIKIDNAITLEHSELELIAKKKTSIRIEQQRKKSP